VEDDQGTVKAQILLAKTTRIWR